MFSNTVNFKIFNNNNNNSLTNNMRRIFCLRGDVGQQRNGLVRFLTGSVPTVVPSDGCPKTRLFCHNFLLIRPISPALMLLIGLIWSGEVILIIVIVVLMMMMKKRYQRILRRILCPLLFIMTHDLVLDLENIFCGIYVTPHAVEKYEPNVPYSIREEIRTGCPLLQKRNKNRMYPTPEEKK